MLVLYLWYIYEVCSVTEDNWYVSDTFWIIEFFSWHFVYGWWVKIVAPSQVKSFDSLLLNAFVLQGQAIDSEHLSEYTEEEMEVNFIQSHIKGFAKYDLKYFIPFFTRRFTQQVELTVIHAKSLHLSVAPFSCFHCRTVLFTCGPPVSLVWLTWIFVILCNSVWL